MEQTIHLHDTTEYLCGICPNKFRRDTLVRHLTQHIGMPDKKHTHFLWCTLCSPLLRNSDVYVDETEYSNEMGIENWTTENTRDEILYAASYILPGGLNYLANNNYEPVNFNDSLNYEIPCVMNKNSSYNESLYPADPPYSYRVNANFIAEVKGGITYFFDRSKISNDFGENVQFHEEVNNTRNNYADVERIESNVNSRANADFDKLVGGGTTYLVYRNETPNYFGENVQFQEEVRNTRSHHADVARIEPSVNSRADATIAETCQQVQRDDTQQTSPTIVETQQATRDDMQQIDAIHAEPCLEDTNAVVPSADNVKTQPDVTKVEVNLDNDISEIANTLNESNISKSSNATCQSYTSNYKLNRNNESHTVSFKLNNLGDGSSSSGHNSFEHADNQCKSVSDNVVNNSSRHQSWDNSSGNANNRRINRRARGSNVSGNRKSGRDSSRGIHFKNYNSRSDCPSSSDCDPNNKHWYDGNDNNGFKNGNSSLPSNRSNRDNSNSASSKANGLICNGANVASNTHCDNELDGKNRGKGNFSGARSEVPKSISSYSAAVKRSEN